MFVISRADASVMPKRHKPVYGKCLLWQPEVAFVYLAVVEQYPDSIETLVAATGAIRNLTSCQWKVSSMCFSRTGAIGLG